MTRFQRSIGSLIFCLPFLWLTSIGSQAVGQNEAKPVDRNQLIPRHLLGLIHAPEVHAELELSQSQRQKLEAFFKQVDGDWLRLINLSYNWPPEKIYAEFNHLERATWQWFQSNAAESQRKRLRQLELRAQNVRMLLRTDLAKQLGITAEQQQQLVDLAVATDKATKDLQQATMKNEVTEALTEEVQKVMQAEQQALASVMQPAQMQKLQEILGKPFDTSQLQRIFPMAPELSPVEHWINSEPLTLQKLRGKVVILHFYAFQCHNCHANFDVYQRWHEKYGDDVVVLGIQTPETPTERDPQRVREAAVDKQLDFPILVDLEKDNWNKWSNTMWPTVYLIDRHGYIRQYWKGELRWKGATGDQKLESIIESLIAEKI